MSEAARIINDEKSAQVLKNIRYALLDEHYDAKIFRVERTAQLNVNAAKTAKNIYDYLIYDSDIEKTFAADMDCDARVSVYAKLPPQFLIRTPVGNYNPDWAIVFGDKIYFVFETKSTSDADKLRPDEKNKIDCGRKHFAALGDEVRYEFGKTFDELVNKISRHAR